MPISTSQRVAISAAAALLLGTMLVAGDEPAADPKAAAAAKLEQHRKKYGPDMLYQVDDELKIIFVMGTDDRTFQEVKARLSAQARALQKDLFHHGFDHYLSVIVPRQWANPKVTGHFYPDWVDAATVGSNLMHEFTHALHYADQVARDAYQPVWLMEGFASMYENSKVIDGHVVPLVNHRLVQLQAEVRQNHYLPLAQLMRMERRQFTSHHYAQARYVCIWLHATGKLSSWYDNYTAGFANDSTGVAATEKIFGKPIDQLTADWVAWVLALEPPKMAAAQAPAKLGIAMRQAPDGITIESLTPNSPAAAAGLMAGDTLIHVAGQRVVEMEELVELLANHHAGDAVTIEYRRDGRYAEVTTKL